MKFFLDAANPREIGRGESLAAPAERMGARIVAMPYLAFVQLFKRALTCRALEGFLRDWEKAREMMGDVFVPAAARNPGH